jgi:hypothetical protein
MQISTAFGMPEPRQSRDQNTHPCKNHKGATPAGCQRSTSAPPAGGKDRRFTEGFFSSLRMTADRGLERGAANPTR